MEKAANFRDLGGFDTPYGTTRPGRIFRADQLGTLSPEDVKAIVEDLKVRYVVDLRGLDEIEAAGKGALDGVGKVSYVNLPVNEQAIWPRDPDSKTGQMPHVSQRYFLRLTRFPENFAKILSYLAELKEPAVFHCVAGRDRTGLIAMLILGAAGVSYGDIADDYAATVRVPKQDIERSRDPVLLKFWQDYMKSEDTTHLDSVDAMNDAMLELLDLLDDAYGTPEHSGIEGYVKMLGVSVESLRGLLV